MKNSVLPFWHVIIGIIGAAVVIASIFLWLQTQQEKIIPLQEALAQKEAELTRIKNQPVPVREVIKEVIVEVEKECETPAPTHGETAPSKPAMQEITLRVPKAILKITCHEMEIGRWDIPKSCAKRLSDQLADRVDKTRHFIAITPVVDSKPYPGPLNELKQAGLAQFRSAAANDLLRKQLGSEVLIFHRRPIQTEDARGFNVELFAQE